MDLAPDAIFGYRIETVIGRGSNALVYRALRLADNLPCALKILRTDKELSDDVQRRFNREAGLIRILDHPGIVRLHDIGRTPDGIVYLVLEFVHGTDLGHLLDRRRQLPIGEALGVAGRVARPLAYAHQRSVVHRDLKPSNILISLHKEVKITDFGLAKALNASKSMGLTRVGEIVGTPVYMAPEQFLDARRVDRRADIYSLGVCLYQMVTGRLPYPTHNLGELIDGLSKENAPRADEVNAAVPASVADVIQTAMRKSPGDRYRTMDSFLDTIKKVARSEGFL